MTIENRLTSHHPAGAWNMRSDTELFFSEKRTQGFSHNSQVQNAVIISWLFKAKPPNHTFWNSHSVSITTNTLSGERRLNLPFTQSPPSALTTTLQNYVLSLGILLSNGTTSSRETESDLLQDASGPPLGCGKAGIVALLRIKRKKDLGIKTLVPKVSVLTFRRPSALGCVLFQWSCGMEHDQETRFQATAWPEVKSMIDGHLPWLKGSSKYQELDSSYLLLEKYRKRCGVRVERDRGPAKFDASKPNLCAQFLKQYREKEGLTATIQISLLTREPSRAGSQQTCSTQGSRTHKSSSGFIPNGTKVSPTFKSLSPRWFQGPLEWSWGPKTIALDLLGVLTATNY